jgi:hypothetical protein
VTVRAGLDRRRQNKRPEAANAANGQRGFICVVGQPGKNPFDHGIPLTGTIVAQAPPNLEAKLRQRGEGGCVWAAVFPIGHTLEL